MRQEHQSAIPDCFNVILVETSGSGDTLEYTTSYGWKMTFCCSVVDDVEQYDPYDPRINGAIIFTTVGVSIWRRVLRGLPTVTANGSSAASRKDAFLELAQKMTADPNLRFE